MRKVIEQASADGIITQSERDRITATIHADSKVTYDELLLVARPLIHQKVAHGQLVFDYQ